MVPKVKLLGIKLNDKIGFNHHINSICKSTPNEPNALIRFEETKLLVNTFAMLNFKYCFLELNVSSAELVNKVKNLQ